MKIDHVGIAVSDLEASIRFYEETLGLKVTHREHVPSQRVDVAFLADEDSDVAQIELLAPTGEEGAIASFLNKRGPGQHHVAFHSRDLAAEMARIDAPAKRTLEDAPRPGARGHQVCFLHPKHCGGVLVELVAEGEK